LMGVDPHKGSVAVAAIDEALGEGVESVVLASVAAR
jgi:hypothetical protein